MGRRVVLRLTEHSASRESVEDFLNRARELGAGPRAKVLYRVHPEIGPVLVVELPESAVAVLERKERPPARSKRQQAVKDQLDRRKAALAAGEAVRGHEPPVARKRLKKKRKE